MKNYHDLLIKNIKKILKEGEIKNISGEKNDKTIQREDEKGKGSDCMAEHEDTKGESAK